jgi:dihydroorotate dehydrogenase electron transfer subunit
MKQFTAKTISNTPLSGWFHELTFEWGGSATEIPLPGQFCTIRVTRYSAPLLRRPFAFSSFDENRGLASIIYKRRGPATELMAAKMSGDEIDVIGPLGTGFHHGEKGFLSPLICVAGGTGFGPLLFLSTQAVKAGGVVQVILGCRTKNHLPRHALLTGLHAIITTDDGSEGMKGTPLDFLALLAKDQCEGSTVCACGPMPLMRGCHEWARSRNLQCYVSLEQIMACGVGACMGCAVKLKDFSGSGPGYVYARACTEGPVFSSERIVWI